MSQLSRFKVRMKNATKATNEYRMSITEARELLEEIIQLEKKLLEKPKVVEVEKTNEVETPQIVRILDGGTF